MEKRPDDEKLPLEGEIQESEDISNENTEKIGTSLLRAMQIAKNAVEQNDISQGDFLKMENTLLGVSWDKISDKDRELIANSRHVFIDKVNNNHTWSEALELLFNNGTLYGGDVRDFLVAGMPLDLVLNDKYLPLLPEAALDDVLPAGLLSDIYQKMSRLENGKERFRELFISGHEVDDSIAQSVFNTIRDGTTLSLEQKADIEVFREMGGNLLTATTNSYGGYIWEKHSNHEIFESDDYEKESELIRETSQDLVAFLSREGMLEAREASRFFENSFHQLMGSRHGTNNSRIFSSEVLDEIIKSGIKLSSENEDVNYWMRICDEKRKNVFEDFNKCEQYEKANVLDEYDFNDQRVLSLFARVLSIKDNYVSVKNTTFYGKIVKMGLLDSDFFREELVKNVAKAEGEKNEMQREGRHSYRSNDYSVAVGVLASKRGLLEELNASGLFDKYPDSLNNKKIRLVREGIFTEKDRLGMLGSGLDNSDYYDEKGELNDYFFENNNVIGDHEEIFDDSEKERCCDCRLKNGDYEGLIRLGESIWNRESVKGAARGFLESYKKLRLWESFLGRHKMSTGELEYFFDESGPKLTFWEECIKKEKYYYIVSQDAEALISAGFDAGAIAVVRGIRNQILDGDGEINDDNLLAALTRFIYMDAHDWDEASENDLKIREAFSEANIANKDKALCQLRRLYEEYLESDKGAHFPIGLSLLVRHMNKYDGAGPLTQIEAFLGYCDVLEKIESEDFKDGIKRIEDKIKGWDNVSKSNFYVTSTEIMRADREFFGEFVKVFDRLDNAQDFKRFAQEIFPLFRAKLSLLKNYEDYSDGIDDGYSVAKYDNIDKKELLNNIHTLLVPFTLKDSNGDDARNRYENAMTIVREGLLGEISKLFTEKFGILPDIIPAEFDKDSMRSIENMVSYLSNIAEPNADKKSLIGYYLALLLTKREDGTTAWDAFRRGEECDPYDYLTLETAPSVSLMVKRSNSAIPITEENIRINDRRRLKEFRSSLQDEVSEIRIGSFSTIDVKLQNLKGNIEELADPDLYTDPIDKAKVRIINQYSPKMISKVATALWRHEAKKVEPSFSEEEKVLAEDLIKLLEDAEIAITPDNIQKYLQQGFKKLGPIAKTLSLIREKNVTNKVAELQDLLIPQGEIVQIFGELGEEFRLESGVIAFSADLEFLESLATKGERNNLFRGSEDEKRRKLSLVRNYLDQIKQRMAELDIIYSDIAKSFENIHSRNDDENVNSVMAEKIKGIQEIINSKDVRGNSIIVSTCTNSLDIIVENIRACLSCRIKGINNDTNLTFGECYKFYVYSQTSVRERGSIADEVVYFVPTITDGEVRMSFVMDQIYGTKNSDVLMGHIGALTKKAKALKAKYPEVPISIFVTSSSASSCSVPIDSKKLFKQLHEIEGATIEYGTRTVDIPESSFEDHYIEIGGGDAYTSGERKVEGIEIIL